MDALTEDEKAVQLANRLTPGATVTVLAEIRRAGIKAWLDAQLGAAVPESATLQEAVARLETIALTTEEIYERYVDRPGKDATEAEKKEFRRRAAIPARETLEWVLLRALWSNNPVREVACDFFRNHFCVSLDKGEVKHLLADWEREVIFKRSLGSFRDLLSATAKHPAMLVYLDNHLSRRPPTEDELARLERDVLRRTRSEARAEEAADIARQRGLNENYARELMELHTLGVDQGYVQDDVVSVAKALTGWTVKRRGEGRWQFLFDRSMHCPGDKPFLGGWIKEQKEDPLAEGEAVLRFLESNPRTARFISWKLCRWLVCDDPDDALVKRITKAFQRSDGSIAQTIRAIVEDPEFFARKNLRTKFKRPWEYVVSALRVLRADVKRFDGIDRALVAMSEPLYRCADPTGYYDQAEAWRDPGALATRWTFAAEVATGRLPGVVVPESYWRDLPADRPREWRVMLEREVLPVLGLSEATARNVDALVERELAKTPRPDPVKLGPLIAAALIGSPEFQKQ